MGRRRYLPVEVAAAYSDGKSMYLGLFMRIHRNKNALVEKIECGTLEREVLYCVHKLQETPEGKRELVEK